MIARNDPKFGMLAVIMERFHMRTFSWDKLMTGARTLAVARLCVFGTRRHALVGATVRTYNAIVWGNNHASNKARLCTLAVVLAVSR